MKKEEIYVVINDEEKRLRAIQILNDEKVMTYSSLLHVGGIGQLTFDIDAWNLPSFKWNLGNKTEITLDQLEQMLSPIKEVGMSLDALKLIAESWGFELVEKEREIKVGDFGKFFDSGGCVVYGFLESINEKDTCKYVRKTGALYINFVHLTDEEKANIQQNW
jgi:hypothetical protein